MYNHILSHDKLAVEKQFNLGKSMLIIDRFNRAQRGKGVWGLAPLSLSLSLYEYIYIYIHKYTFVPRKKGQHEVHQSFKFDLDTIKLLEFDPFYSRTDCQFKPHPLSINTLSVTAGVEPNLKRMILRWTSSQAFLFLP